MHLSFWWMNDNCTFVQLIGKTLDEIIAHAEVCRNNDPCGMLCSVSIHDTGKPSRAAGFNLHAQQWSKLDEWKEKVLSDGDCYRILVKEEFTVGLEELIADIFKPQVHRVTDFIVTELLEDLVSEVMLHASNGDSHEKIVEKIKMKLPKGTK